MLLLNCLFVHVLRCQTLVQQIECAYNTLDSISYIENVINSFGKEMEKQQKETNNTMLKYYGFDPLRLDSIQSQIILDSIDNIWRNSIHFQEVKNRSVDECVTRFSNRLREKSPSYVLNILLKDDQTMQVDTGKLSFNLIYFDEDYKGRLYVYCQDGQYSWHDTRYRTFSRQLANNAPKAFKRIMRKQPKYLLYCTELEGMNTILYVLNDKVYVYRIVQMKEYELGEYIQKFNVFNNCRNYS